ncbi:hypothetical protein CXB65_18880, partial [Pseudomonas monteilii]
EVDFFDFAVGAHHAGLAPEGNREHSIGHQVSALNVGFMEHLRSLAVIRDRQLRPILHFVKGGNGCGVNSRRADGNLLSCHLPIFKLFISYPSIEFWHFFWHHIRY